MYRPVAWLADVRESLCVMDSFFGVKRCVRAGLRYRGAQVAPNSASRRASRIHFSVSTPCARRAAPQKCPSRADTRMSSRVTHLLFGLNIHVHAGLRYGGAQAAPMCASRRALRVQSPKTHTGTHSHTSCQIASHLITSCYVTLHHIITLHQIASHSYSHSHSHLHSHSH